LKIEQSANSWFPGSAWELHSSGICKLESKFCDWHYIPRQSLGISNLLRTNCLRLSEIASGGSSRGAPLLACPAMPKTRLDKPHPRRLSAIPCSAHEKGTQLGGPQSLARLAYFGNSTASITWITPFSHLMSVDVTLALSTMTLPSLTLIVSSDP
jgi:hypothetical protein